MFILEALVPASNQETQTFWPWYGSHQGQVSSEEGSSPDPGPEL